MKHSYKIQGIKKTKQRNIMINIHKHEKTQNHFNNNMPYVLCIYSGDNIWIQNNSEIL